MVYEHSSFRSFLKSELAQRIQKNPKYSLRSFARALGVAPSTLSRIFKGEKSISIERAHTISAALKLSETESQYFRVLVQLESVNQPELKQTFLTQLNELRPQGVVTDLTVDLFRAIADWHSLALLETLELGKKIWTSAQLAAFLDLSKPEVELALERLERLELVKKSGSTGWTRESCRLLIQARKPDGAVVRYYKQVHQKSLECLDSRKSTERAIGTEVFPMNQRDIPKIEKLTDEFLTSLQKFASTSQRRDSVYQALVHVFRLNPKGMVKDGEKNEK